MKKIIILVGVVCTFLVCNSQTYVGGELINDTTWESSGNPYYVTDDIIVNVNVTLTIENGVNLFFFQEKSLLIHGILNAFGDQLANIFFDEYITDNKWGGIHFLNNTADDNSILCYCDIANSNNGGANISDGSNTNIENCNIHHNTSLEGAGINIKEESNNITIENNIIQFNEGNMVEDEMIGGGGIKCENSEDILITMNLIINNISAECGGGLYSNSSSNVLITDNEFQNNRSEYGGAISVLVGFDNIIDHNMINNNRTFEHGLGGGIYIKTACDIVNNMIFNNQAVEGGGGGIYAIEFETDRLFENNEIYNNTAKYAGGMLLNSGNTVYPTIRNCKIYDNIAEDGDGGGILTALSYSVYENCEIYNNCALSNDIGEGNGGGIKANTSRIKLYDTLIYGNSAINGGGIHLYDTAWIDPVCHFHNCTITGNHSDVYGGGFYIDDFSNASFINTILWDNVADSQIGNQGYIEQDYVLYHNTIVKHCDYNSGEIYCSNNQYQFLILEHNINDNPLFVNPDNNEFTLQWNEHAFSPCIDSGDPEMEWDIDETPPDMGCYPTEIEHDYHLTTAEVNRYRYRSIPVIDNIVANADATTYICAPVEEQTTYFRIFNQIGNEKKWLGETETWIGNLDLIYSFEGYKIQTTGNDVNIPTSGETLPEETLVELGAGSNWVGYFIRESMTISDAFIGIWDKLQSVCSEDWAWKNDTIPSERCTLIYGKMYIVSVSEACNFVYGQGVPVDPKERKMTEGFYYVETPEYTPINILSLDDSSVQEVGVFLEGECIGATKVEEFPLQILAFADYGERESGDVSFEFYYGDRNYRQTKVYSFYDEKIGQFTDAKIDLEPYKFNTITFGEPSEIPSKLELLGNYPNPFKPNTTISYSIPSEANVRLTIYNIKGQKIKELANGIHTAGEYSILWDGTNESGKPIYSGIYLYRLTADKESSIKRMLLLK